LLYVQTSGGLRWWGAWWQDSGVTDVGAPSHLFDDPEREARWRARFTAARVSLPEWAHDAQDRNVYVSNASGVWEIYAWDRATDTHRQVTDRPQGTSHATISPDGQRIWWFDDTAGDEFGVWVSEPFAGKTEGEPVRPAVAGTHPGYPSGLAVGRDVVAVGMDTDDGTTIWLARDGDDAEVTYASEHNAGVAALSDDDQLLAIGHSEHGDSRHPALRVVATSDGHTVAEKWDGPGKGLEALGFAPVAGDTRLLVAHERRGKEELLIWDVAADTETVLDIDLPGEITADWYFDGTALLVVHSYQARNTLHRLDLATGALSTLDSAPGNIAGAAVRPDGTVEYSWSSAASPPMVRALDPDGEDRVLLTPPGPAAPPATSVTDAFVDGPGGRVHALVARPVDAPDGPLPTVFNVHGGPHSSDEDRFSAYRAVWLDAGFAVVEVNYRGSTGYGSAWRDAIEGRPGLTELEDIAAVHDWAVREGLADPERTIVEGASWGGYLTLLALGTQPERWVAGVAVVPVADYVAAFEDEMEPLRDFDRALFGGSPDTVPDRYRDSSPITYVDQVRVPVLVTAGENDPRCPIRQIDNYLARLAERDAPHSVYRYDAGHGSLVVAETIKQTAMAVDFARRVIGV
jgi:dipeptidyl aminopeptidase/acylaminoacyl peptidase